MVDDTYIFSILQANLILCLILLRTDISISIYSMLGILVSSFKLRLY